MGNIGDALSSFSQKFGRFKKSEGERVVEVRDDEKLQRQIRERMERFEASCTATYKVFKSPFEALGEQSDRAASIDRDEQALLKAYNLYKGVMDVQNTDEDETGATYISRIEISSPLKEKASYTSGGQFIYLLCWLYFEQNCQEYMPFFTEKENVYSLNFVKAENYEFEGHDKEIFSFIERTFYS